MPCSMSEATRDFSFEQQTEQTEAGQASKRPRCEAVLPAASGLSWALPLDLPSGLLPPTPAARNVTAPVSLHLPQVAAPYEMPLASAPPVGTHAAESGQAGGVQAMLASLRSAVQPGSPAAGASSSSPLAQQAVAPLARGASGSPRRDSRVALAGLTPQQKAQRVVDKFGDTTYCQEIGIDITGGSSEAVWQWLCASMMFSARIKSQAGLAACKKLQAAGFTSPQAVQQASQTRLQTLLQQAGFGRDAQKMAASLQANSNTVLRVYGGDLNQLRSVALNNPTQERALLKKLRGVGDGAVDIFFMEAQLAWPELYPFADRKALKGARMVGLFETPAALAEVAGSKERAVRLISCLARMETTKGWTDL